MLFIYNMWLLQHVWMPFSVGHCMNVFVVSDGWISAVVSEAYHQQC